MKEKKLMYNLGCGHIRPKDWINVDSSFTNMIQKLPLGRALARKFGKVNFPEVEASYMDLNKKWNGVKDNSVDVVYASHLFEHLTIVSRDLLLKEAFRTMKKGAAIRFVVPDMELHARTYIQELDKGNQKANEQFLWALNLHREGQYPATKKIHRILGYMQGYPHQHKFMYDQYSLGQLLQSYGFVGVHKSEFGQSKYIHNISDVESDLKFSYGNSLYLEATKPS